MDLIVQLRQMMAEQNFFEVQKLIEGQLTFVRDSRFELLLIYRDALESQHKKASPQYILELAELASSALDHELVLSLLQDIPKEFGERFYQKVAKLRMTAMSSKGQVEALHEGLSDFMLWQFQNQIPLLPHWLTEILERYFKDDFGLRLKRLGLSLLLDDVKNSESLTRELIISCVERAVSRGLNEKLRSISDVLRLSKTKSELEIYQGLCQIWSQGLSSKTDIKKVLEMVVYFDDYKFQVFVLNLLKKLSFEDLASDYASVLKENPDYDFVYLDKFFPALKHYFVASKQKETPVSEEVRETVDLRLTGKVTENPIAPAVDLEEYEGEKRFIDLLTHQDYEPDQLCDLAVSFLQSEMPRVALKASREAMKKSLEDRSFLKASYLKLTCELQLQDYRAALDTCLEGLGRSSSMDDVLSFLYGEAEIYMRLGEDKEAKKILSRILRIDPSYRSARERLAKL